MLRITDEAVAIPDSHCKENGVIMTGGRESGLVQLLQPSLAFCFSLQPMTAYRPVLYGTPSLATS